MIMGTTRARVARRRGDVAVYDRLGESEADALSRLFLQAVRCGIGTHPAKGQPPVRTAAMSLTWRIAPEQVGIGFVDFDEFCEIIDAEVCEDRYRLFAGAEDDEATVFRVHFDAVIEAAAEGSTIKRRGRLMGDLDGCSCYQLFDIEPRAAACNGLLCASKLGSVTYRTVLDRRRNAAFRSLSGEKQTSRGHSKSVGPDPKRWFAIVN
jgi:hypothetical protein